MMTPELGEDMKKTLVYHQENTSPASGMRETLGAAADFITSAKNLITN